MQNVLPWLLTLLITLCGVKGVQDYSLYSEVQGLQQQALHNEARAQCILGYRYDYGEGIKQNSQNALY